MPAIGYSRYQSVTTALYDKKGLSHYLLRVPTSRYILPLVNFVRDKQIVEVGIGTGYYSKFFQKNRNKITGVDVNPHLCPPEFSVVEASASDFARHITTPHDMIVSFWMTEYLNREELFSFLRESRSVLAQQSGAIFFTIIGYGIGGWFSAQLSDNVTMSNSPLAACRINRMNVFFPINRPVELAKGDSVRIVMQIVPAELIVTWKVEVWGEAEKHQGQERPVKKAGFTHSTFQGMLVSKEDLQKTQPHFIPKLSPWGEARRSVVNLCDGRKTLSEIEQETYRLYPELFPSLGKAAEFVAEVVTRYSL